MTALSGNTILLIGESGVGKTHFGAQLLKRLMKGDGSLRMNGAATNLEPFEAALESLNEGKAAGHTATSTYVDSIWPIADADGYSAELIWPDYGGEQIKNIVTFRRVPVAWQERVRDAAVWFLLVRLQQARVGEDIFSRPLADLRGSAVENHEVVVSDQARLIELLQMLMYIADPLAQRPIARPKLGILLTCWDELRIDGAVPEVALKERLPMLWDFVSSNWQTPKVMGLSALGRPLSPSEQDVEYVSRGPEHFGYVVGSDGSTSPDLTLPIQSFLNELRSK
ncbi:hypothetical protein J6524_09855 [Bradyrhizobium sp. WSM 1738]|uniref:TRAFAC clade GTPase domain-containing protein n=1 Tax=Bradyrhizobium hereditatis TaxID=2821405 RepID=UPI001CE2688D|nr:hypothetical protein [Bradyrhizobium hereditatis]MCA6115201.1 hypothetical protein [Bradyrhizobium hereditatis]